MQIRDVIHGTIPIEPFEVPLVDSSYFQRLRHIQQLGFTEYAFPGATHHRYSHSLGAMHTATQMWQSVFHGLTSSHFERLRITLRLTALFHDLGHGPLSHTSEVAMPTVDQLHLPLALSPLESQRTATHEDYSLKIILDSDLTSCIETVGRPWGIQPIHLAALLNRQIPIEDGFFHEIMTHFSTQSIDFRPILSQMISSEIDADRLDYLRRDSLYTGVSYGHFDFPWLTENLTYHIHEQRCYLSLQHRALYAFEDFLLSRFHMFLMIYCHHKTVIFEKMLSEYLQHSDCDYQIPSNIEQYLHYHDTHLMAHLEQSSNSWAQRIIQQQPYQRLIELYSEMPVTFNEQSHQQTPIEELKNVLQKKRIPFLVTTSSSTLSKYFHQAVDPIFVLYNNHFHKPYALALEDCTKLFQNYAEKRSVTRLYVPPEHYQNCLRLADQVPAE